MKRVGIFLGIEPTWGGAFQYNQTVLDALAQLPADRYQVIAGVSHPSWEPYLKRYPFKTAPIPLGYWGRIFGQLLHYSFLGTPLWRRLAPLWNPTVRAFLRQRCDLWIFPSQDPWAYLVPVPALATIHDLMHRYERRFPEIGRAKEFSWREWHYGNTCRWCRGVLVDSEIGKAQVIDSYGMDPAKVHVLPFIAPAYLEGGVEPECELPEKFLFYPAQFWPHKNHEGLIRAIALLKGRFPDIKLVLAGAKKRLYPSLVQLVRELELTGQVIFLGYVPDDQMAGIYRRARALVMASFCGPTNIPPLEAMKMGCAAAVSGVYGMPEQTKGAALLFDPSSVESMAAVLGRLWQDDGLCRELGARGIEVSREWTATEFNARVAAIVAEVVGG
ncbi:glycosyltransferase family 4 protein [Geomonas sp. Red32]|uniref:glycosyltransferase family 4 protein n=1 Tax=Geomonas sp. Red32 TaxID=2912856 RepID=UPI00202CDDD1|nr:glycosyltransferase family 1 protein [Geomonas sp. Red32]MCM0083496.1 glycosyltransferase family 4 protein [Geomonas sp. Red32]